MKNNQFSIYTFEAIPMFTQNDNIPNNKCVLQRKNAEYFMSCVIKPKKHLTYAIKQNFR